MGIQSNGYLAGGTCHSPPGGGGIFIVQLGPNRNVGTYKYSKKVTEITDRVMDNPGSESIHPLQVSQRRIR